MERDGRSVVVGPGTTELMRRLGPTAWTVLQELLVRSTGEAAHCRATASVRSLASDLGLAKDTVARALGRLRRVGLLTAEQPRSPAGAFVAGSYVIAVPDTIVFEIDAADLRPADVIQRHHPRRSEDGDQLALALDA